MAKTVQRKRNKRHIELSLMLPWQFYLLCKLMEVEPIGGLFPNNAKPKLIDVHSHWRKKYYKY